MVYGGYLDIRWAWAGAATLPGFMAQSFRSLWFLYGVLWSRYLSSRVRSHMVSSDPALSRSRYREIFWWASIFSLALSKKDTELRTMKSTLDSSISGCRVLNVRKSMKPSKTRISLLPVPWLEMPLGELPNL